MGSKISVAAPSPAGTTATRSAESAVSRDPATGATPSHGFSSAMNAAAQPNATNQERARAASAQRDAGNNTGSNANSKAASAPDSKPDDALNGAANVAASDATSIDAGSLSPNGTMPDKTSGKTRSTAGSAGASANAPTTLAMLLAAASMQPTAPGSPSPANTAIDPSDSADDQNAAAQSIAAMVAAAGFAIAATPALAGRASAAIAGSAATTATGVTPAATAAGSASDSGRAADDASAIKFDALMTSASGDSSNDGTALLQTKSAGSDSASTPSGSSGSTIGSNAMPEMVRGLISTASQSAAAARTIAIPVSDRNWSSAVAAQVQWQVNSNVQSATLQLSPDHLGPLEVRIDVQSSQVNVSFCANHADTRAALEQSMPRLREILANGGLTLGQTSVQQEARSGSQFTPPVSRVATGESQNVEPISISSTRAIGLIDEYA